MLLFGIYDPVALTAIGLVLFFGMGWHEYAHAVVADWWGDPTPRKMGRLTPNPIVHINWVGWLMFLILGFGILGSVPINTRAMRDPRWGSFWTSFAGPLSNLLQAVIFGILANLFLNLAPEMLTQTGVVGNFLQALLTYGVLFNVLLFVFNLLPLFPMDGWHMMLAILPGTGLEWSAIPAFVRTSLRPIAAFLNRPAYKWSEWAQITQYAFFIALMIGFVVPQLSPLNFLIGTPTIRISSLLLPWF
ncbi:MAG: site-2 protease family protein [Phototrophicaceae bacterium]